MKDQRLKAAKLRTTANRKLVLSVLDKSNTPMSAEDVFFALRKKSNASLSTIYRTLSLLCEKNLIQKNTSVYGKNLYQSNHHAHTHSLLCSACGKTLQIAECPMDDIVTDIEHKTGFKITHHNLEFVGLCPECAAKEAEKENKEEKEEKEDKEDKENKEEDK